MRRVVSILIVVMVCVLIAPDSRVSAQSRGQAAQPVREAASTSDESAIRAAELADLEAWLERLTGRFRIEGSFRRGPAFGCGGMALCSGAPIGHFVAEPGPNIHTLVYAIGREATGAGDCVGIGAGPGVHCVLNVPWPVFEEMTPALTMAHLRPLSSCRGRIAPLIPPYSCLA